MFYVLIFILELFVLYLIARKLTRGVSRLFYKITKNKKRTVWLFAILFLPGTLIHEMAHFLTALFLFVPLGDIDLTPEFEGNYVKLGNVSIGRVDPIRKTLVGIAPLVFGTILILIIINFALTRNILNSWYVSFLLGYAVFEIGNTMFLSKRDVRGLVELFIILALFYIIVSLLGVKISFDTNRLFTEDIVNLFKKADLFLLVPLGIDLAFLAFLKILDA
jgi:hypothetical protein